MSGYPITLVDLADALCVVVGGGDIAARKVAALCHAGARPVVISPALCTALRRQADEGVLDASLQLDPQDDGAQLGMYETLKRQLGDDPFLACASETDPVYSSAEGAASAVRLALPPARRGPQPMP